MGIGIRPATTQPSTQGQPTSSTSQGQSSPSSGTQPPNPVTPTQGQSSPSGSTPINLSTINLRQLSSLTPQQKRELVEQLLGLLPDERDLGSPDYDDDKTPTLVLEAPKEGEEIVYPDGEIITITDRPATDDDLDRAKTS